jgi:1-acyl-sn-glycerol-3-phosphate acyltransferase
MYRIRWWIGGVLARLVTLVLFKGVEIVGSSGNEGPRLVVANHFGGLVDAIVVVRALGGLPHIVAKSTLFKRLPLRLVLRLLGVVPVYRRSDQTDTSKNTSSFDEVADALRKGRTVLIFPEGTVTDTQELQTVRTGAARMALRAIETGTDDLTIVPVGITYEDKVSSRSRVLVEIGEAITDLEIRDLADGTDIDEANHPLVASLTARIRERLAAVAPDYGSLIRERTMMLAASIRVRSSMTKAFDEPSMSSLRSVAQRLARVTEGAGDAPFVETGGYQLALTASGLEDHQVQPTPSARDLAAITVRKALIVLVISPLALLGLAINLAGIMLVILVGAFVKEPVSKGTARVITGLVVFPALWIGIAIANEQYWWLALIIEAIGLVFLLLLATQVIDLFEAASGWWAVRNHVALIPDLQAIRAEANAELAGLLEESPEPGSAPPGSG